MAPRDSQVRGPTSALTAFLKERGIRRQNLAAVPSEANGADVEVPEGSNALAAVATEAVDELMADAQEEENAVPQTSGSRRRSRKAKEQAAKIAKQEAAESSDLTDENEAVQAYSPVKQSNQPEASSSKKPAAKKLKKKKGGSNDDFSDEAMDLVVGSKPQRSAHSYKDRKPGSIDYCIMCATKFTITVYTEPYTADDGRSGALCYKCAKIYGKAASAGDKPKAAAPRKRAVRRGTGVTAINAQDLDPKKRVPSLQDLCIGLIGKHIEEVEALGDIGALNMEKICKIISRNRSLTNETVKLFVEEGMHRQDLTLYDATKINEFGFIYVGTMCRNLTRLQINLCGQINDQVIDHFAENLTQLRVLDLDGPFLVTTQCWKRFFQKIGSRLEGFCITQTARIDTETIRSLTQLCPNLEQLRLSRIGKLTNDGVYLLTALSKLRHLELSWPGSGMGLVSGHAPILDDSICSLVDAAGANLESLVLDGNRSITDRVLIHSIMPHCRRLTSLSLEECEELTTWGAMVLFRGWAGLPQLPPPMKSERPRQDAEEDDDLMRDAGGEEEPAADTAPASTPALPAEPPAEGSKSRRRGYKATASTLPTVGGSAMEAPTGQSSTAAAQLNPSKESQTKLSELPKAAKNEGLYRLNLTRCLNFDDLVLDALLTHSSHSLRSLSLHSLDHLSADAVRRLIGNPIPDLPPISLGYSSDPLEGASAQDHSHLDSRARLPEAKKPRFKTQAETEAEANDPTKPAFHGPCSSLKNLDLSWVRSVDDFTLADIIRGCTSLEQIKVWGCSRVTDSFGVKEVSAGRGVRVIGRERDPVFTTLFY